MKIAFVIWAFLATLPLAATPAFASGYGPAPFYRPEVNSERPHWRHARDTENDSAPQNEEKPADSTWRPESDPAHGAPANSVN
jgi:hypothetical protein